MLLTSVAEPVDVCYSSSSSSTMSQLHTASAAQPDL
jgi:hypothetical protein